MTNPILSSGRRLRSHSRSLPEFAAKVHETKCLTHSRRRPDQTFALLSGLVGLLFVGCVHSDPGPTDVSPLEVAISSDSPLPSDLTLEESWIEFLQGLDRAREALEDPRYFPPEPSDRNLAEGYRYLLGHLVRIIETQTQRHPDFPYFQRSIHPLSKWTLDNPDTLYLSATIDAEGLYRIRGRALDHREWRTSGRAKGLPRAPRVVIFQTTTAIIGQTGDLSEMAACRNQTLDSLNQFELELDEEGAFEILVGARKPSSYTGHYLASRAEVPCPTPYGTTTYRMRDATQLNVRETFSDWRNEIPLELEIVRLDKRGEPRPTRTSSEMGTHLREIGRLTGNQIKFWNQLHEFGLEVNGDRNGDGRLALPLNALNPAKPPFIAGGTAGAGQLYSAGTFELPDNQALVVRVETPAEPHYIGFQLSNLWGESPDQANYVSSQTGGQNAVALDGARYYIVSKQDPGTPGWLDTTGLSKVTMSMRFIYKTPPSEGQLPKIETWIETIDDVRNHLPDGVPFVSSAERRREVDIRQRHIQKRWRQY